MAGNDADPIAPEGDVIFVVGQGQEKQRLRVSSTMLSSASSAFKALFGPHFREGQQERTSTNPVDIALPHDNPAALSRLCQMLHFRAPVFSDNANDSALGLFNLAVVIDKYTLGQALSQQSAGILLMWLDVNISCKDTIALANIVAASYLTEQPHSFFTATERLIRKSVGSVTQLYDQPCMHFLPSMLLGECCHSLFAHRFIVNIALEVAITERRLTTQMYIAEKLSEVSLSGDSCPRCTNVTHVGYQNIASAGVSISGR